MSLMITITSPLGEDMPISIDAADTVDDVLKQCASELSLCPSFVDLAYEGETLDPNTSIMEYGISCSSVLEMVDSKKTIAIRKLGMTPSTEEMIGEVKSGAQPERISLFLDAGLKPTPQSLYEACLSHNTAAAELFIINGVSQTKTKGRYPLHGCQCACTAQLLLRDGADSNCVDDNGYTPLQYRTSLSVVKTLIDHKCDINIKDNRGNSPIMACYAYDAEDISIAQELLAHNPDLSIQNTDGMTILHLVKDIETAEMIIDKHPELLDVTSNNGNAPLHYCWGMRSPMTRLFVDKGASVNLQNDEGMTPLHYVETCEAAKYLLDHGADLSIVDHKGRTPLHSCFGDGENWPEIAKIYINRGADIHATDNEGYTLLHYITDCDIARILIDEGVDINAKSKNGLTPLMYQCMEF